MPRLFAILLVLLAGLWRATGHFETGSTAYVEGVGESLLPQEQDQDQELQEPRSVAELEDVADAAVDQASLLVEQQGESETMDNVYVEEAYIEGGENLPPQQEQELEEERSMAELEDIADSDAAVDQVGMIEEEESETASSEYIEGAHVEGALVEDEILPPQQEQELQEERSMAELEDVAESNAAVAQAGMIDEQEPETASSECIEGAHVEEGESLPPQQEQELQEERSMAELEDVADSDAAVDQAGMILEEQESETASSVYTEGPRVEGDESLPTQHDQEPQEQWSTAELEEVVVADADDEAYLIVEQQGEAETVATAYVEGEVAEEEYVEGGESLPPQQEQEQPSIAELEDFSAVDTAAVDTAAADDQEGLIVEQQEAEAAETTFVEEEYVEGDEQQEHQQWSMGGLDDAAAAVDQVVLIVEQQGEAEVASTAYVEGEDLPPQQEQLSAAAELEDVSAADGAAAADQAGPIMQDQEAEATTYIEGEESIQPKQEQQSMAAELEDVAAAVDTSTPNDNDNEKKKMDLKAAIQRASLDSTMARIRRDYQLLDEAGLLMEQNGEAVSHTYNRLIALQRDTERELKQEWNVRMVRQLQDDLVNLHEREIEVRERSAEVLEEAKARALAAEAAIAVALAEEEKDKDPTPRIHSEKELEELLSPERIFGAHDARMERWCKQIMEKAAEELPLPEVPHTLLQTVIRDSTSNLDDGCASPQQTAQLIQSSLLHLFAENQNSNNNNNPAEFDHASHAAWVVHEFTSDSYQHRSSKEEWDNDDSDLDSNPWWMLYIPDDWIDLVAYFHSDRGDTKAAERQIARWGNSFARRIQRVSSLSSFSLVGGGGANRRHTGINPPEAILHPLVLPGACWPLKGSQGHVTIALPYSLLVTAISIDHASRWLLDEDEYSSAPKQGLVVGYPPCQSRNCQGLTFDITKPLELLQFTYDVQSFNETRQTFFVEYATMDDTEERKVNHNQLDIPPGSCVAPTVSPEEDDEDKEGAFCGASSLTATATTKLSRDEARIAAIRVDIKENYGHSDYTCLYRVRIHGELGEEGGITIMYKDVDSEHGN